MKTFTLTKKILCLLLIVFSAFFINSFSLITSIYASTTQKIYYYNSNTNKITNGDFSTSTTSSDGLPKILKNGWTAIESTSASNVTAGVINVETNTFNNSTNNKYGLELNPEYDEKIESTDTNILMIKANNTDAKFGYVSNDIQIEADKYYRLSIRCKTGIYDKDNKTVLYDATASIYTSLSGYNSFTNISTSGNWKTFNFFIATDTFDSSSFNIELRLGNKSVSSEGAVFFDYVVLSEISNLDFYSASEDNQRIIDLNSDFITSFTNSNFEIEDDSWVESENNKSDKSIAKVLSTSSINQYIKENFKKDSVENIANSYVYNNNKSLLIANTEETSTTISSAETNILTIAQHGFYKLSLLIKTGDLSSGGLTITLTDNDSITTTQSNLTSSSNSLDSHNGFTKVDFYIRGNVYKDTSISISFTLGSDNDISGWAIIDNITLQKINANEYAKKTDSNSFDLSKNVSDTETITNGSFNFVSSSSANISYPSAPEGWTASDNANNLSGIIRVRTEYFNKDAVSFGLTSEDNPGPNTSYPGQGNSVDVNTTDENVLMIRNNTNEDVYYTFTGSKVSLNASSSDSKKIYKIQVAVKTLKNSKAFIRLVDSNNNIIAIKDNISSSSDWTNYTIFIKNGISSQEIKLELGTHGNGENNYAFFDYVKYVGEVDMEVSNILSTPNSIYTDLMEDSFYNYSTQINNGLYTNTTYSSYNPDTKNESAIYNGILNTASSSIKTRPESNNKNVFVVSNTVASYQLLISNYTYKLESGSYYEFSVWIKTDFEGIENLKDSGALFEIVNVDSDNNIIRKENTRISNIITNSEENNGWVKYSIYILSEESQNVKILLGLGDNAETYLTQGRVYFDDVVATDITKSVYSNQKQNETTLITKVVAPEEKNKNNNETSTPSNENSGMNIWALLSSIILVIALALAIAGYLIRRIPKNKATKVGKSDYNKAPASINENEVRRELKLNREKKLEEINKELEELTQNKTKLQEQYEKESSVEENLTQKEKLYAKYTKEINKLNKKIDYLNSAISYSKDQNNIKAEETREIKKRKKEAIEEFSKLKIEDSKNIETSSDSKKK